ncbi:MAG: hypothetical protein AAFO82_18710 [Bacteroidota bacterium]
MEIDGRLNEELIQNNALIYLSEKYYKRKHTYAELERYTNAGKRADGLICFPYKDKTTYVISLEAKSYKTLKNLKPYFSSLKGNKYSRIIAFVLLIILSFFIYTKIPTQYLDPLWVILILTAFIGAAWFILQRLKAANISWTKSIPVIEQLAQYPANEKWLAIGNDSVKDEYIYQNLLSQCHKFGIGVLIMDQNERFEIKHKPKYKTPDQGKDFLSNYIDQKEILNQIGQISNANKTKAHFYSSLRSHLRNLCFAACFLFVVMYGMNQRSSSKSTFQKFFFSEIEQNENRQNLELSECPFFGINETLFVIVDELRNDEQSAIARCYELRSLGFQEANFFHQSCISSSLPMDKTYCIYPFPPSLELNEMKESLDQYRSKLSIEELNTKFGRIVSISK